MTEAVVTLTPRDTAARAAQVLLERKINALPIVDAGRLVGIVSRSDLLHLLIRLIEGSGQ